MSKELSFIWLNEKNSVKIKRVLGFTGKGSKRVYVGGAEMIFFKKGVCLESIFILEKFRKKGYGKAIIEEIKKENKKTGNKKTIYGDISKEAIKFYKKLGFSFRPLGGIK